MPVIVENNSGKLTLKAVTGRDDSAVWYALGGFVVTFLLFWVLFYFQTQSLYFLLILPVFMVGKVNLAFSPIAKVFIDKRERFIRFIVRPIAFEKSPLPIGKQTVPLKSIHSVVIWLERSFMDEKIWTYALVDKDAGSLMKTMAEGSMDPKTADKTSDMFSRLSSPELLVSEQGVFFIGQVKDGEQHLMRRMIKRISRELVLPIYEIRQKKPMLLNPDEIGMPIREKMTRGDIAVQPPGRKPEGIKETVDGEKLILQWQVTIWQSFMWALLLGVFIPVCFYTLIFFMIPGDQGVADIFGPEMRVYLHNFCGLAMMLLLAPFFWCQDQCRHKLIVTNYSIIHQFGRFRQKEKKIQISKLEDIRGGKAPSMSVILVGAKNDIDLLMETEMVEWTKARIAYDLVKKLKIKSVNDS